jgi:hypothetical protein
MYGFKVEDQPLTRAVNRMVEVIAVAATKRVEIWIESFD